MTYDHREKAGNRGDVVKHPALLAALDTVIREGKFCNIRYADLFAGFAYTTLKPSGEWLNGIGALQDHRARVRSPHLKGWLNRCLSHAKIIGSAYPGSSMIATDVASAHNCRIEMALWDTSAAVCDNLTSFYAGTGHRIFCREATDSDKEIRSADFLFIDPPGLRSRQRPVYPTLASILSLCVANHSANILVWLPVQPVKNRRSDSTVQAAKHGLSSTTACWTEIGPFIGCQLLYRLPNTAINALRVTVEEVAELDGWYTQINHPVRHMNA